MKFRRFILPNGTHAFYQEGDAEAYKELVRITKRPEPPKGFESLFKNLRKK